MNFPPDHKLTARAKILKTRHGQGSEAHKPIQQKPSAYQMAAVYQAGTSDGCHVKRLHADSPDRNLRLLPRVISRQTQQAVTSGRYHLVRFQTDTTDRHHRQAPPTKISRRLLKHGEKIRSEDSTRSENATASERLTLSDYSEMMTNELPFTHIGYSVPQPNYLSLNKFGSFLGST